jgi:TnpA family transposase
VRTGHPLLEALTVIRRHAKSGTIYYSLGESVPEHKGVQGDWAALVYRTDHHGNKRVVRQAYEVATFRALREQLLCKEVWVLGAGRYRDPNEDLPKDFESRRVDYYWELRKPLDPTAFCDALREEMTAALGTLNAALPNLDWVRIAPRKAGPIKLTPLDAAAEPRNLRRIKHEVTRRWTGVPLIDFLKEALLRSGALDQVVSVAGSGSLPPDVLAERLMLAIYAYGTNTGMRAVIPPGGAHSEEEVRYARRRYLTVPVANAIATALANATFAARDSGLWGAASTAVASDSTHFRAWDQNLFTEWLARYGGRGILVYWHVEEKYVVVHCQVLKASASEVAAMVEGAVRHGTAMKLEGNYTDTHGQSLIGFGVTRLLDIDLLPRIKQINAVRLYRPESAAGGDPFPRLAPALHGPVNWRVIAENYDTVVKYATAIHERTASTEAVLSRFRNAASHPAYQAMLEIGKAQRTIFVARLTSPRAMHEFYHGHNRLTQSATAPSAAPQCRTPRGVRQCVFPRWTRQTRPARHSEPDNDRATEKWSHDGPGVEAGHDGGRGPGGRRVQGVRARRGGGDSARQGERRVPRGRVHGGDGAVRIGQVDADALHSRARHADVGAGVPRRPRAEFVDGPSADDAAPDRGRLRVPGVQPGADADRTGEHHAPARPCRHSSRRGVARYRGHHGRPGRPADAPSGRAVRRSAAAGCGGARAGDAPADRLRGRADRQSRLACGRADPRVPAAGGAGPGADGRHGHA